MLPTILLVIAAVLVVLVIFVSMQASQFRIVRSTSIAAPASVVFPMVNDFHNWNAWSPWRELDPNMTQTFEGAPSGVGAIQTWAGNKKAGEGRMTITQSRPNELITTKLEFFKPFKATNNTEFTFKPQGEQTQVTWIMTGEKNFIFKAMHLIMNMDKLIGGDFEKGLARMKAIAEAKPHV
jgi:hypothetical protein